LGFAKSQPQGYRIDHSAVRFDLPVVHGFVDELRRGAQRKQGDCEQKRESSPLGLDSEALRR